MTLFLLLLAAAHAVMNQQRIFDVDDFIDIDGLDIESESDPVDAVATIPVEGSKPIKCIFIRHAISTWNEAAGNNKATRSLNWTLDMLTRNGEIFEDAPLSDNGEKQAGEARKVFKAKYPEVKLENTLIYSSPLRRAMQTANFIFPKSERGLQPIYTTPYLREISSNSDGVSFLHDKTERRKKNSEETEEKFGDLGFKFDFESKPDESSHENNFRYGFDAMIKRAINQGKTTLVIVGHSNFALKFQQAKCESAKEMKNKIENAGMITFEFDTSKNFRLDFWDRIKNITFEADDLSRKYDTKTVEDGFLIIDTDFEAAEKDEGYMANQRYRDEYAKKKKEEEQSRLINRVYGAAGTIRGSLPSSYLGGWLPFTGASPVIVQT